MRVRGLLGMLALLVLALSPVHAEEPRLPPANPAELEKRAVRLDALFARLASTNDADEGDTIVEEIWRVWLQSGRPEIDAMMQSTLALLQAGEPRAARPPRHTASSAAPTSARSLPSRTPGPSPAPTPPSTPSAAATASCACRCSNCWSTCRRCWSIVRRPKGQARCGRHDDGRRCRHGGRQHGDGGPRHRWSAAGAGRLAKAAGHRGGRGQAVD